MRQRGCKPWPSRCNAAWRWKTIGIWPTAGVLTIWRSTLLRAEEDYRDRLTDPRPEIQQVARRGLAVIQRQQAAMDRVLA